MNKRLAVKLPRLQDELVVLIYDKFYTFAADQYNERLTDSARNESE